jgi:hypothetical protein
MYFSKLATTPNETVTWEEFYNRLGTIPVKLSRDILGSDEAIVAVIAHEIHELESLRALFEQRGGRIPGRELRLLTIDGRPGNLHDHAWDVADALVAKMRGTSTAGKPAPEKPTSEKPTSEKPARGTHD